MASLINSQAAPAAFRENIAGKLLMIAFLVGLPLGLASSPKVFGDAFRFGIEADANDAVPRS